MHAPQLASNFGPVAPFDCSLLLLLIGGALITATWSENYGDNRASGAAPLPAGSSLAPPNSLLLHAARPHFRPQAPHVLSSSPVPTFRRPRPPPHPLPPSQDPHSAAAMLGSLVV